MGVHQDNGKLMQLLEGSSFIILLTFLFCGKWWIQSVPTEVSRYYMPYLISYFGEIFLFLPLLLLAIVFLLKIKSDNLEKKHYITTFSLFFSSLVFLIYGIFFILYDSSSARGFYITYLIFQILGYIGLIVAVVGLKNFKELNIYFKTIYKIRGILISIFVVFILDNIWRITMHYSYYLHPIFIFSTAVSINALKALIAAVFLFLFFKNLFKRDLNSFILRSIRTLSKIFLVSTIIIFILTIVEWFGLFPYLYDYFVIAPLTPTTNLISLLDSGRVASLFFSILLLGAYMFQISDKKEEANFTLQNPSSQRILFNLSFVLFLFFIAENNYMYCNFNYPASAIFLTVYETRYIPDNLVSTFADLYTVNFLIILLVISMIIFNKFNKTNQDYSINYSHYRTIEVLVKWIIGAFLLSILTNFIFRVSMFSTGDLNETSLYASLTIVKGFEELGYFLLGVFLLLPKVKFSFRRIIGVNVRFLSILASAVLLQFLSGFFDNFVSFYDLVIDYNPLNETSYRAFAIISMLFHEFSTILIVIFIIIITLNFLKENKLVERTVKILSALFFSIIMIFKMIFIVGGLSNNAEYISFLYGYDFMLIFYAFDGFAVILFTYLVIFLGYGILKNNYVELHNLKKTN